MSGTANEVLYWPAFFGYMGVASALIFANAGAAYGTARSGNGLAGMAITNPAAVIKNIIPIIMAGILGIYGLIVAVILLGSSKFSLKLVSILCNVLCSQH
jgi:ATP synthase proteolipid subunit